MKKFTVLVEFHDIRALTPANAARNVVRELMLEYWAFGPDETVTVIAEDGHTSLVKVGSDG